MPDTYGKRQRQNVKAKKAAEREERRVARNQRREDRAGDGQSRHGPPVDEAEQAGSIDAQPGDLEPSRDGETELDEKV